MQMRRVRVSRILSFVLSLAVLFPSVAAAQYTAVDLRTPGGGFSIAYGINNRGQAVGRATIQGGDQHAVLWEGGTMRDLGTLPGGRFSEAYGINDRGQVVGMSSIDSETCTLFDGCWHAFLWENGTMTDLGGIDARFQSYAYSVNKRGQVAGIGNTADYPFDSWRAFVWDNGTVTDLGQVPGASNTMASGINDRGDVAGWWTDAAGSHPALWTEGAMVALATLPGATNTEAYRINRRGQIIGVADSRAVLWTGGTPRDLGTLPGGATSTARDLNNAGQVAGYSLISGFGYRSFVWDDGRMTELATPTGAGQAQAHGINDRGDIVGYWDNGSVTRAVVWVKR
jgi:probable HAF family extracellular repeat protein